MESQKLKLIFGLSPISTFINAAIILAIPSFIWVYSVSQKFFSIKEFENSLNFRYENPWYINLPLIILGYVMFKSWMSYKFGEIKFGFKYIFQRFIPFLLILSIYQALIEVVGIYIVL